MNFRLQGQMLKWGQYRRNFKNILKYGSYIRYKYESSYYMTVTVHWRINDVQTRQSELSFEGQIIEFRPEGHSSGRVRLFSLVVQSAVQAPCLLFMASLLFKVWTRETHNWEMSGRWVKFLQVVFRSWTSGCLKFFIEPWRDLKATWRRDEDNLRTPRRLQRLTFITSN